MRNVVRYWEFDRSFCSPDDFREDNMTHSGKCFFKRCKLELVFRMKKLHTETFAQLKSSGEAARFVEQTELTTRRDADVEAMPMKE